MSNNLLKGKRGVIFGALDDQSIAWKVAEKCVEEGATIVLTNAPVAMRFGKKGGCLKRPTAFFASQFYFFDGCFLEKNFVFL
jgi:hypothetical protein